MPKVALEVHTAATKPKEAGRKSASSQLPSQPNPGPPAQGKEKKGKRRPPRTAAVIITCSPGGYKNFRLAVEKIDLSSLGIEGMGARRAVTEAHIF